jgi:hypothetical protein
MEVEVFYDLRDEIRDIMHETNDISEPMESSSKIVPETHLELIRVPEIEGSPVVPDISEDVVEPNIEPLERSYFDIPLEKSLQDYILELCYEKYIDPELIFAMISVESSYKADTIGDNGNSFGLMQIQPRWHQKRMDKLGCDDLLDPYQNVTVGIDYFTEMLEEGGTIKWALLAYNGGPSYANRMTDAGETSAYVTKVYDRMNALKEQRYEDRG